MIARKIKITREELCNIFTAVNAMLAMDNLSVQLAYSLSRNKQLMKGEVETLAEQENAMIDSKFKEYEQKRLALAEECADRDPNDLPLIRGDSYQITGENKLRFDKEFKELSDEYKKIIDKRKKDMEAYADFMKEKITVSIYDVKFSEINKLAGIKGDIVDGIFPLIVEDKTTAPVKTKTSVSG